MVLTIEEITNPQDLLTLFKYLIAKLEKQETPVIHVLTLINNLMKRDDIYTLLNDENRSVARELWYFIGKSGSQLPCPPMFLESGSNPVVNHQV
jgi:Cdc6-like AAA superfamily ATPase